MPNIVKISLKRVKMNFCPGKKNFIYWKNRKMRQNYQRINFYKVSLIKTGLFHKYHLLNTVIQKITKMSFNIPLRASGTLLIFKVTGSNYLPRNICEHSRINIDVF